MAGMHRFKGPLPSDEFINVTWPSNIAGHDHVRLQETTMRPTSSDFWAAYLNYVAIPAAQNSKVWDKIGGSIGESYGPPAENSCAARVSYGLNYGKAPIVQFPAASVNLRDHTYNGKSGD